jgi:Lon protease-like protein
VIVREEIERRARDSKGASLDSDPEPRETGAQIAPVFPLPRFFLYPGTVVPLHIFEPRYRAMIGDLLDGPGRLVMGTVLPEFERELADAPAMYPTAGLGEIGRHEHLPDGRYNILLVGIRRVKIREVESDRAYRKVEIEALEEIPVAKERQNALRTELQKAILARCNEFLNLPSSMPITNLADLLIQRMDLPLAVVARMYAELDVESRALQVLAEHKWRPLAAGPDPDGPIAGGTHAS